MTDYADTCPNCGRDDACGTHSYLGNYNVECGECEHVWNLREDLGLSPTNCEACGARLSFGCGHEVDHEVAALAHAATTEHLLGDCACFESRPGYAARFTRGEWRERAAQVLRIVDERHRVLSNPETADANDPFQPLLKALYGHRTPTGV
jgi:hypothetical protein